MKEWKTYRIGDICKTNSSQYSTKEAWDEFLYLDTGNITRNIIEDIVRYASAAELPSRARRKVVNDDIIFSTVRPNQCHFGILSNPPANLLVSTGFTVITANKKIVDPYYLYYYLTQDSIVDYLHSIGEQAVSAYPSIKAQDIEDIEIELPDLSTQNNIAKTLRALDNKIQLNRQINDNLEQQALALYKSWFVDFEPFKDEEFIDSELGMIPKGWAIGKIEDLTLRMASGGTPKSMNQEFYSGDICWFTTKELVDGFLIDSEKHISQSAIDNSAAKIFPKGSVLMAIYAAPTVGRLGILSCNAAFNQAAVALIPKVGIGSGYIYLTLYNERNNFNNLSSGAAQQNLNVGLVKNYPTRIPSQEVLNNFETKISPIFMNIERNQREINNLTRLRDTLLPKLMSGELKLTK